MPQELLPWRLKNKSSWASSMPGNFKSLLFRPPKCPVVAIQNFLSVLYAQEFQVLTSWASRVPSNSNPKHSEYPVWLATQERKVSSPLTSLKFSRLWTPHLLSSKEPTTILEWHDAVPSHNHYLPIIKRVCPCTSQISYAAKYKLRLSSTTSLLEWYEFMFFGRHSVFRMTPLFSQEGRNQS